MVRDAGGQGGQAQAGSWDPAQGKATPTHSHRGHPGATAPSPLGANGIQLVDEDDGRSFLLGQGKGIPDQLGTIPDEHLHQLGPSQLEEGGLGEAVRWGEGSGWGQCKAPGACPPSPTLPNASPWSEQHRPGPAMSSQSPGVRTSAPPWEAGSPSSQTSPCGSWAGLWPRPATGEKPE